MSGIQRRRAGRHFLQIPGPSPVPQPALRAMDMPVIDPPANLLYGLDAAIDLLFDEGLAHVFARHRRHAEASRKAVAGWGSETVCRDERPHSPALTGVLTPEGYDADQFRRIALDISLGTGLGRLAGKAFRIGHLGDINDLTLGGGARRRGNGPRRERNSA